MNVVDSSGWIEYLSGGENAETFRTPIEDADQLLVPALSLFEVYRHLIRHLGQHEALEVVAVMREHPIVPLDDRIALEAAETSAETGLPTADSIILTSARLHNAVFWTQDSDFEGMDGVEYFAKKQLGSMKSAPKPPPPPSPRSAETPAPASRPTPRSSSA